MIMYKGSIPPPEESRAKKRRGIRKPVSCIECRRRKLKCDKQTPCDSCKRRNIEAWCAYNSELPTRNRSISDDNDNTETIQAGIHSSNANYIATSSGSSRNINRRYGTASNKAQRGFNQRHRIDGSSFITGLLEEPYQQQRFINGLFQSLVNDEDVTAATASQTSISFPPQPTESFYVDIWNNDHGQSPQQQLSPQTAMSTGFPFFETSTASTIHELLSLLPEVSVCEYLLERYIHVYSSLFHILHEPTFREEHQQFMKQKRNDSVSLSFVALLYVIQGLAIATLEEDDAELKGYMQYHGIQTLEQVSHLFLSQAKKCLVAENFMVNHSITTLQALILLVYGISHLQGSTGIAWPILGLSVNIAVSLGCHIDGDSITASASSSIFDIEQKRRNWCALLLLDMLQTFSYGRPSVLNRDAFNTTFPRNINDDELTNYTEDLDGDTTSISGDPDLRITQMTYMNCKYRFYSLTSTLLPRLLDVDNVVYWEVRELDSKLVEQRRQWDKIYLAPKNKQDAPYYHFVQYDILYIYLNQVYLLLHRPHYYSEPFSRQRCVNSSMDIIGRFQNFCKDEYYKPFKWYARGLGGFYCFHAAIVLSVIMIEDHKNDSASSPLVKEEGSLFEQFELALNLLLSLSPQSEIVKKATHALLQLHQKLSEMYKVKGSASIRKKRECEPSLTTEPVVQGSLNQSQSRSTPAIASSIDLYKFTGDPLIMDVSGWTGPKSFNWIEWDSLFMTMNNQSVVR